MKYTYILATIGLVFFQAVGNPIFSQNFSNGFPFHMPYDDTSTQAALPAFPKQSIGNTGFVAIDPQGHFSIDNQRVRFWGANLTASACFPDTVDAAPIAGRMRKMGFNLMRFHHMDNPWTDNNGTLFVRGQSTRSLNPNTLDKFEYFIHRMKQEGVYANINLNVSRPFNTLDGVAGADSIVDFAKGVTLFDPQLISLQKEFAMQLLTHINPYTGLSLVDDPVMAMLEVVNENSLDRMWKFDQLKPFTQGGNIMQRHSDMLDNLWIDFLQKKYGSQTALATSWNLGAIAPGTANQITNGDFESNPTLDWQLELHSTAAANFYAEQSNPYRGTQSVRVNINQVTGTDWHIQFKQTGLDAQEDSLYYVQFYARADRSRSISVTAMRDNAPYTWYNGQSFQLDTNWQLFTFSFVAPENNIGEMRLSFGFNNETGPVWLDEVTLGKAPKIGLPSGQDLQAGSIERIPYAERFAVTPNRIADQTAFYISLQTQFNLEMKRFLKDTLGVRVPITSNNALNGPGELMAQSVMDYVDDHAYWDHPQFPNQPWSSTDWRINNTAMIHADPAQTTIAGLFSGFQLAGKPYTLSEYNHAFPNRYEAEMLLWMLAYGSFHDVDAIMFYDYNGDKNDWKNDMINNYFSIHRNASLMSLNISCAYAFRHFMQQTAPASRSYDIEYDSLSIFRLPQSDFDGNGWGKAAPFDKRIALENHIEITGFQANQPPDLSILPQVPTTDSFFVEKTLKWKRGNSASFSMYSPYMQAGFGSSPMEAPAPLSSHRLRLKQANEIGYFSVLSLDTINLAAPRKLLLSLGSKAQNTNMLWSGNTTISNNWGNPPSLHYPFHCDIEWNIQADSLIITPLNPLGEPKHSSSKIIESTIRGAGLFEFSLDLAEDSTYWYSVACRGFATNGLGSVPSPYDLRVYPNPSSNSVYIQAELHAAESLQIDLFDLQGHFLFGKQTEVHNGLSVTTIDLSGLASGTYQLVVAGKEGRVIKRLIKKITPISLTPSISFLHEKIPALAPYFLQQANLWSPNFWDAKSRFASG